MNRSPYDNVDLELKLWRFYGLFDIETSSETKKRLFRSYAWLYWIFGVFIGFLLQFGAVFLAQSAKDAAETLYVSVSFGNAMVKLLLCLPKRGNMRRLYDNMNSEEYRSNGMDEQRYVERFSHFIRNIHFFLIFVGAIFLILITKTTVMDIHGKTLPVTSVLEFDYEEHAFWFWTLYAYQFVNGFFGGGSEFAINLYLYFIILCIEFTINLLGARLRRFGYETIGELTANQAVEDHKIMVELIKHHIESGKLVNDLLESFDTLLFIQVIQSAFASSNGLLLVLTSDEDLYPLFVDFCWVTIFILEMALFCYFGNNVRHASSELVTDAYFSNFVRFDKKTRNAIQLLMQQSHTRPFIIRVGGILKFELSLPTLLQILKTTYSIIMLVRSIAP